MPRPGQRTSAHGFLTGEEGGEAPRHLDAVGERGETVEGRERGLGTRMVTAVIRWRRKSVSHACISITFIYLCRRFCLSVCACV